jgi:biopolymer transport protein ExbD
MAIRTRNKRDLSFNFSSMSDLVFLLLIFFVLTSTLIAPNAIKLLLPASNSRVQANPQVVQVYIDAENQYYLDGRGTEPVTLEELEMNLSSVLSGYQDASVVVRADQTVDVQYVVTVIDMVKGLNDKLGATHKVVLATRPK